MMKNHRRSASDHRVRVGRKRKRLFAGSRRSLQRPCENVERPRAVRFNAVCVSRKVDFLQSNFQTTCRVKTRREGSHSRYRLRTRTIAGDRCLSGPSTNCRQKQLIRRLGLTKGRPTRRQTMCATSADNEADEMPSEEELITGKPVDGAALSGSQRNNTYCTAAVARRRVEMLRKRCRGKIRGYVAGSSDAFAECNYAPSNCSSAREPLDSVVVDCLSTTSSKPTASGVNSEIESSEDESERGRKVSPSDRPSGDMSRDESRRSETSDEGAAQIWTIGEMRARRRRRGRCRWQVGNWQKRAKLIKRLGCRPSKRRSSVVVHDGDDDSRTLDCFPPDAAATFDAAETVGDPGSVISESTATAATCFLADHFSFTDEEHSSAKLESHETRLALQVCAIGSLAATEKTVDCKDESNDSNAAPAPCASKMIGGLQTSELSAECCQLSVLETGKESKSVVERLTDCVSESITDSVSILKNADSVVALSESFHAESCVAGTDVASGSRVTLSSESDSVVRPASPSERSDDERLHSWMLSRTRSSVSVKDECASDVSVTSSADTNKSDIVMETRRRELCGSVSISDITVWF